MSEIEWDKSELLLDVKEIERELQWFVHSRFAQAELGEASMQISAYDEDAQEIAMREVVNPSQMEDDPLLALVSPDPDPYEHAEERRIMYVAMTRARLSLTILAPEDKPSDFVRELLGDPVYGTAVAKEACEQLVPCVQCGGRMLFTVGSNQKSYYRCEHIRHCGHILPACSCCHKGFPLRSTDGHLAICRSCETEQEACGQCPDGWLVERSGRNGRFLGCSAFPKCGHTCNLPVHSGFTGVSQA